MLFYPEDEHVGIAAGHGWLGRLPVVHCAAGTNGVAISHRNGFETAARTAWYRNEQGAEEIPLPSVFLFGISDVSAFLMRDVLTFRGTMKLDAMKRQGARMDLTSCQIGIRPQRLDASARAFLRSVFYRSDNDYRNSIVSFCNTALLLISDFFPAPLANQKEARYNMTRRTKTVIF